MSDDGKGMKRPHEGCEEDMAILKKRRGEGPHIEFRALIPSKSAGAVIGRGGTNIRRLRQDYKASVTVPDSQGPERILTLGANVGTVCEILVELVPQLDDPEKRGGEQELRFLIHQSQAGCIIGRAGFKIKELREETGTNIKVYTQPAPQSTERCVSVTGKPGNLVNCIAAIYELLESAPPKGFSQAYDPHNYDEFYAADYGGYTFGDKRTGEPRGAPLGGPRGKSQPLAGAMDSAGSAMGRSGGAVRSMRGGAMPGLVSGRGGGRGGGGGGGMNGMNRGAAGAMGDGFGAQNFSQDTMGGMGSQGMMFGNQAASTTQVSIPKDLAGAIIGKGGTRIRQIRQESGASITIDEPLPGSTDRIITITGSQEQIQNAQYLLQMSVYDHSNSRRN